MANIKDIFKITFALQLLVCALATFGHPDAEVINFGSPTQPSQDQLLIEAAIKRGMDGDAVAELLRTRQPVVRTTTTPGGFTKTTTYKLEKDGSISSKTIIQQRHRYTYNSEAIPDNLKNAPSRTATRTFTDNDGNKVTQTISINHDKPGSGSATDNLSEDWYNKAFPSWPSSTSWSSDRNFPRPRTPLNSRRTSPSTYTKPNEEKQVIETTSTNPDAYDRPNEPKFPPIGDMNWPGFDFSTLTQPWDNADPDDFNDSEVVKDPEITTKKTLEQWTPRTWEWQKFPTHTTTTTTTAKPRPSTRKPLLSLDEFLKSQYDRTNNKEPATSTAKSVTTTTEKHSTTTPKFIKIEDLPVAEVLHNGKPADESILKTLPSHLTPRTPTEQIINIEHKYPIEQAAEDYIPKVDTTNVRTFSKTHIGHEKPKLKDFNPQMQAILRNAGIIPEIEGDTITKTRTEPDGRTITTTYKVNTVPSLPAVDHYGAPQAATHSFNSYSGNIPFGTLSPISEFLAKLGLTKFDITSGNGPYSKTIIDENGDVLTATFVLSSPNGLRTEGKPLK